MTARDYSKAARRNTIAPASGGVTTVCPADEPSRARTIGTERTAATGAAAPMAAEVEVTGMGGASIHGGPRAITNTRTACIPTRTVRSGQARDRSAVCVHDQTAHEAAACGKA